MLMLPATLLGKSSAEFGDYSFQPSAIMMRLDWIFHCSANFEVAPSGKKNILNLNSFTLGDLNDNELHIIGISVVHPFVRGLRIHVNKIWRKCLEFVFRTLKFQPYLLHLINIYMERAIYLKIYKLFYSDLNFAETHIVNLTYIHFRKNLNIVVNIQVVIPHLCQQGRDRYSKMHNFFRRVGKTIGLQHMQWSLQCVRSLQRKALR